MGDRPAGRSHDRFPDPVEMSPPFHCANLGSQLIKHLSHIYEFMYISRIRVGLSAPRLAHDLYSSIQNRDRAPGRCRILGGTRPPHAESKEGEQLPQGALARKQVALALPSGRAGTFCVRTRKHIVIE